MELGSLADELLNDQNLLGAHLDEFLFVGGPWGDAFATIGEHGFPGMVDELVRRNPQTNTVTSGSWLRM
ncbi:hypothetical protein [Bradyrhizobium sp. DASA03007]|uniref:hypothetical protein n=1 Tax=unclassified Bradyrhizobium TaxID=2631580 RepID=UPI003F702E96